MKDIDAFRHAFELLRRELGEVWQERIFKLKAVAALGRRTIKGGNQTVNDAMKTGQLKLPKSAIETAFPGVTLPPANERLDFDVTKEDPEVIAAFYEAAGWEGAAELNLGESPADMHASDKSKNNGEN